MKRPEMIIVHYVHEYIRKDFQGKYSGKYVLSFAGVSDKPSKLMHLQVWEMSFVTRDEALKTMTDYQKRLEGGKGFLIVHGEKRD